MRYAHVAMHLLVALALPPLGLGVITKTKALVAGRLGPPVLQPYFDIAKLLRKGATLSRTTSWLFLAGPAVGLVTTSLAALLVPLGGHAAPIAFEGDFLLVAYALALGRFATILAALDTGSSFEGMGSAREATYAALAEPTLFFGFLALARASGASSLSGMLGATNVAATWQAAGPALAAIAVSWFIVLLAENSRIPFDDPNTHLELTMVHEVMVLDHSGPPYGLILTGSALKLFVFGALVLGVAVPLGALDPWVAWPAFAAAFLGLAVVVGLVESAMARLRLPQVPSLLVAACLVAGFGAILLVR